MKNNPPEKAPVNPSENEGRSTQWLDFLNLGWAIVGNMLLFVGGGLWLDKHFKTTPALLLIGVFLAFFGSGYSIYRAVKKAERDEAGKPRK